MLAAQEAEAAGCRTSIAVNASQGRCFGRGPAVQSADELKVESEEETAEGEAVEEEEDDEDDEEEEPTVENENDAGDDEQY